MARGKIEFDADVRLILARDVEVVSNGTGSKPLPEQCPHSDSRGRYVLRVLPGVRVAGEKRWHGFSDPSTKLQALSFVGYDNGATGEVRRRRIHWLCFTCGQIMPLGDYSAE